jgi:hypothetical protein
MAIPSRQIGWGTQANLLWQISKQLERLICVAACECPTTTTTTTAIPAFRLSFVDISFANELVGDATNVNDWNTYLDLPTNGTPFDSVIVTGNEVALYGGADITIKDNAFEAIPGKPPVPYLTSIIDEGGRIIEIGDQSFRNQTTLTVFTAPNVTTIGIYAFDSCGIISVNFPLLVNIGIQAFGSCPNLSTVTLNSATSLSNSCFNQCTSLTTINCPLLETIGDYCFANCSSIISIDFPLVTYLGEGAFSNCASLESIKFDLVTSIPAFTFVNTAIQTLTSTNFPVLTTIGQTSFGGCLSLTSVNLPSVTSVAYYGFGDCTALIDVQLPNVTYTAERSFRQCLALTNFYMPSLIQLGESVGDNLVFVDTTGATLTFTIPAALMTCDAGNPDGDIQYLQANNTVTIVTV